MIVLNKKKIKIAILSLFVLAFGCVCIKEKLNVVPTVSLPVSSKTIVIDARTWKTR